MLNRWKIAVAAAGMLGCALAISYIYKKDATDSAPKIAERHDGGDAVSMKHYSLSQLVQSENADAMSVETITSMIRERIAPDSWLGCGGMGLILIDDTKDGIDVSQTASVHRSIQELIVSLEAVARRT